MGDVLLELGMLVILVGALAGIVGLYLRGRRGVQLSDSEIGQIHLTGVSPPPNAMGEQYVTLTGNLTGPSQPGTVAYGRFVWDVGNWPSIGDTFTVAYPPGKPEQWQIAPPGADDPFAK